MLDFKKKKRDFDLEPHEILLDRLAKEKEREMNISEKRLEKPFLFPFYLLLSLLFLLFSFYCLRLFWLQIIKGKDYLFLSQANQYYFLKTEAARGIIYDQNLVQLSFNKKTFDLVCEKNKFSKGEIDSSLELLSQILRQNKEELEQKIKDEKEQFLVFQNLDQKSLILLQINLEKIPACSIKESFGREYREGETLAHIIGYLGLPSRDEIQQNPEISPFDKVGKEGVEKFYDQILREQKGEIKVERDAKGKVLKQEVVKLPQSGNNLVLWLDFELQKKIKEVLEKRMLEVGAKGGAAVAMDPETGGILAMVSLPSFDNNIFSRPLPEKEWSEFQKKFRDGFQNRAISGQYLLGSTIKPFIAIAALEEKIVSPKTTLYCPGEIEIPNPYFPEIKTIKKDWTIHGLVDLEKAIAESCNVFFYAIGGGYKNQVGLGPTKIKNYLQLFGFGSLLPIDLPLPSFATGFLPDPKWKKAKLGEDWWDGDTYNLAIGQGYILATPLQVATAYSSLINGGKLLKPMVVKEILDSKKNVIQEFSPQVIRENFISSESLSIVKEGMKRAVTGEGAPHATAILLNSLPKSAGAKTGTAETFRKDCPDCYNFWITVFAPYENPKIVLVLMLEDVKGYKTQVLVPVAKEILDWYLAKDKN
jgi:penicillin-binding protein 2